MSDTCWIVLWPVDADEPEAFGPFGDEDECYTFAAKVSVTPNDWRPVKLVAADSVA